ncbi:MAG: MBL fold metallo-hydrolase [Promethearchaeota archaeon]
MVKKESIQTYVQQNGVVLQILGSGGPFAGDKRASSGYLVWFNGRPQVMIDAGGGTYLRMQQAGARIDDIKLIAISHFHPDHSSELPALLWSDYYSDRKVPLVVTGPSGSGATGLTGFLDALANMVMLTDAFTRVNRIEVSIQNNKSIDVYKDADVRVAAFSVDHGPWPTLAYRIEINDVSIGYGADQTGSNLAFTEFVQGVDILIMHMAVSEEAQGPATRIHAKPSVVGKIAQKAGVRTLVLSHFMKLDSTKPNAGEFSLSNLESNLAHLKKYYFGSVVLAEDLQCTEVVKNK